jgi:hypothetical protein
MEKVFSMVTEFFGKMTALFMGLLSFAIVAEILFGTPVFGMSVLHNVMNIVDILGGKGVVGLIALVVLCNMLEKK